MDKLNQKVILIMLEEADTKWFAADRKGFKHQEHLEFVSEYVAKNYARRLRQVQRREGCLPKGVKDE